MGSNSDRKTGKSPDENEESRVIEDDRGHRVWQGTIDSIKMSLMKTGMFRKSEAQQRLIELYEAGSKDDSTCLEDELELMEKGGGFDPYDSAKK